MKELHKNIVVASKNPVKIQAALQGFETLFPKIEFLCSGVHVDTGVSAQPMSDHETLLGAKNRVKNARKIDPAADYWVGIEGGVEEIHDKMWVFAWVVIQGKNNQGMAKSSSFILPPKFVSLLHEGFELGEATDKVFGLKGSKQKGGVIGALTHGHIDRKEYYIQPMILALLPFLP